jgi:hypothetical protein
MVGTEETSCARGQQQTTIFFPHFKVLFESCHGAIGLGFLAPVSTSVSEEARLEEYVVA